MDFIVNLLYCLFLGSELLLLGFADIASEGGNGKTGRKKKIQFVSRGKEKGLASLAAERKQRDL